MSLLSRNTGGGRRRVAKMAAVFAGTLLTYLVVTAVPAFAVTTCVIAPDPAQLNVSVGTDDTAAVFSFGGNIIVLVNGGLVTVCPAGATEAAIDYINVTGRDAGNETVVLWNPETGLAGDNTSVGLGNGNDTLIWEYGNLGAPWALGDIDPGVGARAELGTADSGVGVGNFDSNVNSLADLRIDNAEVNRLNGDAVNDILDAGNLGGILPFNFGCCGTADAIPGATAPFAHDLTLNGAAGDDDLVSGNGNDTFTGGPGSDGVNYEAASGPVVIDLTAGTATGMGNDIFPGSDIQNAEGGDFDDTITGNGLNNVLSGGEGNDVIDGLLGNDTQAGNDGNDTLLQGTAADGSDVLSGGANTAAGDTVDYSGRTGALFVQPAGGAVSGEGGCPLAATCEGDNISSNNENYLLGSAADKFVGAGVDEYIVPGLGDDNVDGNAGFDYLSLEDVAGPGTFNLITGQATGAGTDTFSDMEGYVGTPGDDSLVLGNTPIANGNTLGDFASDGGIDTIDASARTQNLAINLQVFGFDCSPTVGCLEVENVTGGSGNDTIIGNGLNNTLLGNDGVDAIDGFTGNDFIEGGAGNDLLTGGLGADTISYKNAPSGEEIDNQLGFASGGDGEDSIAFFEIILGSDFADTIVTGQTDVSANQRVKGRGGEDNITGSNSSDLLVGGGADDTIRAGGGDDTVKGNAGNDFLVGGRGFDIGFGGKGTDTCKQMEQKHSC